MGAIFDRHACRLSMGMSEHAHLVLEARDMIKVGEQRDIVHVGAGVRLV